MMMHLGQRQGTWHIRVNNPDGQQSNTFAFGVAASGNDLSIRSIGSESETLKMVSAPVADVPQGTYTSSALLQIGTSTYTVVIRHAGWHAFTLRDGVWNFNWNASDNN